MDIHAETAAKIFKKDINAITKEERLTAKRINYDAIYEHFTSEAITTKFKLRGNKFRATRRKLKRYKKKLGIKL